MLIGSKEQLFIVHKDAVCAKSKFFKAACSSPWKEGQENIVRLPEEDPSTFQCYVDWVYGGKFVATVDNQVSMSAKLHVLGDILDDVKLRNVALKALHSYACIDLKYPGSTAVRWAWKRTPPHSLFRKWIVDVTFFRLDRANFENNISDYPKEFVQQIALKGMQQVSPLTRDELQAKLMDYVEKEDDT